MEEQLVTGWGFWLEPLGGDFDVTNIDDVEDFSYCKRRAIYDLDQISPVRKLIVPSEIVSERKSGEVCSGLCISGVKFME